MNRLSYKIKISYAMGGLALNLANLAISQWLLKLYVPSKEKALVGAMLFSVIFFAGRLMDGVLDPVIGYWSDHLKSKRGRRIPFIMYALVPVALVSFLLWTPPVPQEYHWINGVYIFIMVQGFFILWTILANPYMALIPELTPDLKERVNITTLQAVFLMLGTLAFAVLGLIKEQFGWVGIGGLLFIVTIVSFLPTLLFVPRTSSLDSSVPDEPFRISLVVHWIGTTFKNRAFVVLIITTTLFWFALNLVIIIIPFWTQYVLGMGDDTVPLLMAPLLGANILFFFVFNFLANRLGKYHVFLMVLMGSALSMPLFWLVGFYDGVSLMAQTQVVMVLVGAFMAGFMMLPFALLSDVIDYDEILTGKRREGIYFGVQSIFQKISIGLSIIAASWLMYLDNLQVPTETGLKAIAILAGVVALISFLVFIKYPLREKEGKVVVAGLE